MTLALLKAFLHYVNAQPYHVSCVSLHIGLVTQGLSFHQLEVTSSQAGNSIHIWQPFIELAKRIQTLEQHVLRDYHLALSP
ncbi:uncharacterized protein EV420DRAFT_1586808 [Desarmillaria tabescens]|uniref:Uncharacterized protein n=1 Tax=Armillaria tabescens TaxID=1929756 RepID=A0AA39J9Q0_ARMTA|nr:uncharacterized protein EV420DRAFT_1586808 [Desarmillaria tabescens]KAK0437982.1 hypothetical protein EV420DRAFT_1586808 [Desarmillaria tabescens]